MLRQIVFAIAIAFGLLGVLEAKPVLQRRRVSCYDSKDGVFTSIPASSAELRRGAFPITNRAIVLDLYRPVAVDKVVIPLRKFAAKHPDTKSEADRMQVYAGLSPDKLELSSGVKVTVTAGEINGVPSETVTITNLPEARYLLFYAPRTDKNYVFGIQDGKKEIQVWADAPLAVDPAVSALPDVSTLDPNWAAGALPVVSSGFQDIAPEVATAPYLGKGAKTKIGWPIAKRFVEFELKESQPVGRIVIDLIKMEMQFPEMTTGLENGSVYQSEDGKNFRQVPVRAEHKLYRRGGDVYARVTLSGDFRGKYFRILAPWKKRFHIFGCYGIGNALKVFPPAK